jgi:hypothetical protein
MHLRIAFATLALVVALPSGATVRAYAPRDLHEQWERAKHVALVRIATVQRLGVVPKDLPMGSCGVLYEIEVLEQFKGKLPRQSAFATHRILFPERPLRVKEDVLVFLRDLKTKQPLDRGLQHEFDAAAAAIMKCGSIKTTLYVAMSEENVFPLLSNGSVTRGEARWLEYRDTLMPEDVQPKLERLCEPLRDGGCVVTQNPRVAWLPIRRLLKSWSSQ